MKPWIQEDIFKMWTDAQKRLWENLCTAVPFQPPAGVEAWRETYLKNLGTWETAVKQTLSKEVVWVEEWIERVSIEQSTPEVIAVWTKQMQEVLQYWRQTQNQWWDEYFAVLRRGGFPQFSEMNIKPVLTPVSTPVTTPEPVAKPAQPVVKPEPVAKPAQPVVKPEPVAETAKPTTKPTPVAESVVIAVPIPQQPDDLKLINGIGPAMEKRLRACGINTYRQLALFSDEDIDRIDTAIKALGRIRRDAWVDQAKKQHFQKYQEQL